MTELLHPARVLQLAAVLVPPLAVIAPRSLAVILPLTALAAAAGSWRKSTLRPPPMWPTAIVVVILCWSAATALWSVDPRLTWSAWPQVAGLAACGLTLLAVSRSLDDATRNPIGLALALGVLIALALLLVEWASARLLERSFGEMLYGQFSRRTFYTYVFNRATSTLALMVWPAAFAVHRRFGWRWATALVVATLVVVSRFDSMASIVGLSAGLGTWLILSWPPRAMAIGTTAVLAIAIALSPLVIPGTPAPPRVAAPPTELPHLEGSVSVTHRLKIWQFVAEAIAERPIAGWGLNASRELPGGSAEIAPGANRLPLHPHNAFLQILVELGAVGAALVAALGIMALGGALRPRLPAAGDARFARAAALALMVSGTLVAGVAFGIWQGWWMAVLWLAAGILNAVAGSAAAASAR